MLHLQRNVVNGVACGAPLELVITSSTAASQCSASCAGGVELCDPSNANTCGGTNKVCKPATVKLPNLSGSAPLVRVLGVCSDP